MSDCPNILTVDVEDWFHILEFDGGHTRADWPGLETRVTANTDRLLGLFAEFGVKATFFVVGWVAEREPGLVRRIADAGHEVGCHSYWHEVLQRHDRTSLRSDLEAAKKLLEDISGSAVSGFRAPGGSLTESTLWSLDVIAEVGFSYDSSVWPGYASHGGLAAAYPRPHRIRTFGAELVEIPASTMGIGRFRLPYAGGGYLRLLPGGLVSLAFRIENARQVPVNLYLHPREIDPGQPRMKLPLRRRFKYYVGLASTERKLRALLGRHRFTTASQWIREHQDEISERTVDLGPRIAASEPRSDSRAVPPPPPVRGGRTSVIRQA